MIGMHCFEDAAKQMIIETGMPSRHGSEFQPDQGQEFHAGTFSYGNASALH